MNRPIFSYDKNIADPDDQFAPRSSHAGLWYDKFCNTWQSWQPNNWSDWNGLGDSGKREWIETVTDGVVGNSSELSEFIDRRNKLLDCRDATISEPLTTQSRFVTGLGRSHPVENGFAWHHTLGTPYLPGSSVKGLVRHWATQWEGISPETDRRIFGNRPPSDNDDGQAESRDPQVGSVIFMDAVPERPVSLVVDVMTPHYGPWYQDEPGAKPADWHDPTPIPFLVVDSGVTFHFALQHRRPGDDQASDDVAAAFSWLKQGLQWLGAGAKTAVGYGRFG